MQEKYVSIDELADHFCVSVPTVRAWIRNGKLSPSDFLKVGNTYRFRISEVESVLRGRPSSTTVEAPQFENNVSATVKKTPQTDGNLLIASSANSTTPNTESSERLIDMLVKPGLAAYEDVLGSLVPREADIWRMRVEKRMTHVSIGKRMNLSRQSVARIFLKTTRKLYHPSRADTIKAVMKELVKFAESHEISELDLERVLLKKYRPLHFFYCVFARTDAPLK